MTFWGAAAVAYGVVMAGAALSRPVRRRPLALVMSVAYTLMAAGAATLAASAAMSLIAPGALLLAGYWLSGLFLTAPQPWFEAWLMRFDHRLHAARWAARMPSWFADLLELSYASVHLVVAGGAIASAFAGLESVNRYWSLVLTAELLSYAALPWLQSRPPRVLEGDEPRRGRPSSVRRLNLAILDGASVQANTFPSGHVSGAVAAALGVMALDDTAGWALLGVAGLIAAGAVTGRYHYAVDCASGVLLSVVVWSLM